MKLYEFWNGTDIIFLSCYYSTVAKRMVISTLKRRIKDGLYVEDFMEEEYKTSVDRLFMIVPIIVFAVLCILYRTSTQYFDTVFLLLGVGLMLGVILVMISIMTTKYMITSQEVVITNLFYFKRIDLCDIERADINENGINCYAASVKQVNLVLKENKTVKISPANREKFIETLKEYQNLAHN